MAKKQKEEEHTIDAMLARVSRGEISAETAKAVLVNACNITPFDFKDERCLGESLLVSLIRAEV